MKKLTLIICLTLVSAFAFAQWTWQNPLPTGNDLQSVYFFDDSTGFSVGNFGTIIKTTDGGTKWTALQSGTTAHLNSIYFTSAKTGYVTGNGGTILKTVDGGTTWTALHSGTELTFSSVYFTDHNSFRCT